MSGELQRPEATIARLEIQAAGVDPIAARLRVERMLGTVQLRPRGLGPRAVLCVRELRDPLPGRFGIDGPGGRLPPEWERALEQQLERLARGAAWPARGAVPPSAEAVAFVDEAELLACLGSDLATDGLGARWWWPLLVRGLVDPARAVGAAFARVPEHVPAAVQLLAERRQAEAVVRALAPEDRARITSAVAARFALHSAAGPLSGPRRHDGVAPPSPWRHWVEEAAQPGLPWDARELLGVALSLARAPVAARAVTFAEELVAWRAYGATPGAGRAESDRRQADPSGELQEVPAPPRSGASPPRPAVDGGARDTVGSDRFGSDAGPDGQTTGWFADAGGGATPQPVKSPPEDEAGRGPTAEVFAAAADVSTSPEHVRADARTAEPPAVMSATPEVAAAPPPPQSTEALDLPARWEAPSTRARRPLSWRPRTREFGAATDTGLGGLFYLINAALSGGVYGGDDEPVLSLWDFLALLGRRWLGPAHDRDPVWGLLAVLAGRADDDSPGAAFQPPRGWGGPRSMTDDAVPLLERWLADVAGDLEARLRRALDLDDGGGLAALLLAHRARVHVTDTHLDVVLALDDLPVAIRLAGLDRDPGWVAAAGRFVAFHFE